MGVVSGYLHNRWLCPLYIGVMGPVLSTEQAGYANAAYSGYSTDPKAIGLYCVSIWE